MEMGNCWRTEDFILNGELEDLETGKHPVLLVILHCILGPLWSGEGIDNENLV